MAVRGASLSIVLFLLLLALQSYKALALHSKREATISTSCSEQEHYLIYNAKLAAAAIGREGSAAVRWWQDNQINGDQYEKIRIQTSLNDLFGNQAAGIFDSNNGNNDHGSTEQLFLLSTVHGMRAGRSTIS